MTEHGDDDGQPILTIIGDAVALGPQYRGLSALVHVWLNDFAVRAPLGLTLEPLTREAANRLYEDSEAAPDQVWFALYERATLRPIGITGLREIEPRHGTAEFVIFIGEQDAWGRGYGTETARLMLDYAFTALGLQTVVLRVFSSNVRGIRAYRRAGFREIGRRRAAHRQGHVIRDVVLMDCLAGEVAGLVLRRVLEGDDAGAGAAGPTPAFADDRSPTR